MILLKTINDEDTCSRHVQYRYMIVFTIFPLYVITCAACDQETGNFLLVAAQSGCKGSEARDARHRHAVPQPQRASLAPCV